MAGGGNVVGSNIYMTPLVQSIAEKCRDDDRQKIDTTRKKNRREHSRPPSKLTRMQILQCRALYEFAGYALRHLRAIYGCSDNYIRQIVYYHAHIMLIPKETDLPSPLPPKSPKQPSDE